MPDITAATSTYGSDEHGLVCGYVFRDGRPGEPLSSADAVRWLAEPTAIDGGFAWLHFNLSHAGALRWLQGHADLPEGFYEALQQGPRSTHIERDGDTLFAVVNDVTFDFSFEASDVATLWVSLSGRLVVSARSHPLRAIDRLRADVKRGEVLATPVALLDHLLRDQADELQRITRKTTERVDDIEDELLAGKSGRHSTELSRLRRLMVRLQRLLAPEPGALLRMLGNPPAWVSAADVQQLRQASEDFALTLRDVGALQERVKLLQEESAARVAEENNRILFLLTMVTVLALPINLVAGLLGMNVGGVPLSQHEHGFWIVVLLIAAITGIAAWVVFKRLGPRR